VATIQQSIALTDGVTPQFQRMAQAAEATTGKFEKAAAAANRLENTVSATTATQVQGIGTAAHSAATGLNVASAAANKMGTSIPHTTVVQIQDISAATRSTVGGFEAATNAASNFKNNINNISGGGLVNIRNALDGLVGKFVLGNIIANIITIIAEKISEIPGKLAHLSDEYSGIVARIKLITSSAEEAAAMNDQIYYSALRARGSYSGMADAVSKIGLTAREAFPDPNAIVPFVENIQKLFTVGGTGIEQQKDAMLQLTQALGSGKLQGDEFRSIAEAAPMIEQIVAHFMGVTQGELKQLSSDGQITAEIMKNAILGATDEINAKFATMPLTWGQIWQNMQTVAFRAFVPVFEQISAIANSPAVRALGDAFGVAAIIAGEAVFGIINNLRWVGSVSMEVGGYIGDWLAAGFVIASQGINELMNGANIAFPYIVGAVLGLAVAWAILNYQVIASITIEAASVAVHALVAAWMWIQTAAVWAVATAKAVWASITMVVTSAQMLLAFGIALVTGHLYIVAAVIIGVVVGALAIWGLASINLRDAFAGAIDFMIDACQNGVNTMAGMINGLIDLINKAAGGLNSLFGTNIGTVDHVGTVDFQGAKQWTGYLREGTFLEHLKGAAGDIFSLPDMTPPPVMTTLGYPSAAAPADVGQNTKDTADNTGKIKDAMEITDEDIKYLRDIAEQEVINKYTTAEVKIEMGGIHNSVSSDMDIDGMVRYINDSLFDAMTAGAEKVHP
jgi:tape measure domain-containing protein